MAALSKPWQLPDTTGPIVEPDRVGDDSSACEAGIVYVLKRPWTEDFLDEVCHFPRATHDDQVIAAAGAFNDLVVTVGEVITVGLNLGG